MGGQFLIGRNKASYKSFFFRLTILVLLANASKKTKLKPTKYFQAVSREQFITAKKQPVPGYLKPEKEEIDLLMRLFVFLKILEEKFGMWLFSSHLCL
jgi:hypothetical protein